MKKITLVYALGCLLTTSTWAVTSASDTSMSSMNMSPPATVSKVTQEKRVQIKEFAFVPAAITISAGDTITWINQDAAPHDVKSEDKTLNSTTLSQGDSYRQTFNKPGTYTYICSFHPFMKGTVIVKPAAGK